MTKEEFNEQLDIELSWRKREISSLLLLAEANENRIILKSFILLLYAHWEGYIKKSSKLYLKYISDFDVTLDKLPSNFSAITLKGLISECIKSEESLTLGNEISFMNKYKEKIGEKFHITDRDLNNDKKSKTIIDTKSNLSSTVFENILEIIGLKYFDSFRTRQNYIDTILMSTRNKIGHGDDLTESNPNDFILSNDNIRELKDTIINIIDIYTENLKEHVKEDYFLLVNSLSKNQFETELDERLNQILNSEQTS